MASQASTHLQVPSMGTQHPAPGFVTAQVDPEHQVVLPGPMGPQAQPVQTNGRMGDTDNVDIKEEPSE